MKLGEKDDFGRSTTLKPKVLEPGTQVPTRGPVVSEGKLFLYNTDKKDLQTILYAIYIPLSCSIFNIEY